MTWHTRRMPEPETLARLVQRLRIAKYGPNRRDADKQTGIPYSTWQNIETRGTLPTLPVMTKLAAALEVPERTIRKAWDVSLAAKEAAKAAEIAAELDRGIAARQRRPRGSRPSSGRSGKQGSA